MKTKLLYIFLSLFSMTSFAQNFQLHYDFGRHIYNDEQSNRQPLTLTFEQFKPDALGSWFYFIDLDLRKRGMAAAYTEISREFNFKKECPFAAHIEYNGGLNTFGSYQHALLLGPAFNHHNDDFSRTWSVQLMYKQYFKGTNNDAVSGFQTTGVWGIHFADRKWTFSGFADLWYGPSPKGKSLVFLTEPQLWYNITSKFSVGSEIEMSKNFIYKETGGDKFFVNPTLAVKYSL